MNDPQIAIQLHWIAEAIFKLAHALDVIAITGGVAVIVWTFLKD
jgi:hypothetical protein